MLIVLSDLMVIYVFKVLPLQRQYVVKVLRQICRKNQSISMISFIPGHFLPLMIPALKLNQLGLLCKPA